MILLEADITVMSVGEENVGYIICHSSFYPSGIVLRENLTSPDSRIGNISCHSAQSSNDKSGHTICNRDRGSLVEQILSSWNGHKFHNTYLTLLNETCIPEE